MVHVPDTTALSVGAEPLAHLVRHSFPWDLPWSESLESPGGHSRKSGIQSVQDEPAPLRAAVTIVAALPSFPLWSG